MDGCKRRSFEVSIFGKFFHHFQAIWRGPKCTKATSSSLTTYYLASCYARTENWCRVKLCLFIKKSEVDNLSPYGSLGFSGEILLVTCSTAIERVWSEAWNTQMLFVKVSHPSFDAQPRDYLRCGFNRNFSKRAFFNQQSISSFSIWNLRKESVWVSSAKREPDWIPNQVDLLHLQEAFGS